MVLLKRLRNFATEITEVTEEKQRDAFRKLLA
jgi:hypothetical protein